MSIQLKNVEIFWVSLDPNNVDMGFDQQSPQWCVDVRTRDQSVAKEWESVGMNPKTKEDDDGVYYNMKLKKTAVKKNGSPSLPVPVVDGDLMPIEDVSIIGNGSRANIAVHSFDYTWNGKKGVGFRLEAVQMLEVKEYTGASGEKNYGFEVLPGGSDVESVHTEGLYD